MQVMKRIWLLLLLVALWSPSARAVSPTELGAFLAGRQLPASSPLAPLLQAAMYFRLGDERMAFDAGLNLSAGPIDAGLNVGGCAGKLGLCIVNSIRYLLGDPRCRVLQKRADGFRQTRNIPPECGQMRRGLFECAFSRFGHGNFQS